MVDKHWHGIRSKMRTRDIWILSKKSNLRNFVSLVLSWSFIIGIPGTAKQVENTTVYNLGVESQGRDRFANRTRYATWRYPFIQSQPFFFFYSTAHLRGQQMTLLSVWAWNNNKTLLKTIGTLTGLTRGNTGVPLYSLNINCTLKLRIFQRNGLMLEKELLLLGLVRNVYIYTILSRHRPRVCRLWRLSIASGGRRLCCLDTSRDSRPPRKSQTLEFV